jgi:hypothetical protein
MKNSRSKRQVIILDCCFSGAFADGLSAKDDGSVDIRSQLGNEGAAVLTSSSSIEYSFEQQGSDLSVYTRYLIEGIETGAADQNNDGCISIDELHEYAKRKVQETVPAMKPEIYAVKEGFKILLAKASIGDPKLRYRKDVEQFASRGEISEIARIGLEAKRVKLGLLPEEAAAIEAEVIQPYQLYKQNLQQYEQEFNKAAKRQFPFSSETRNDLKYLQQALGLRDSDVAPIEAKFTQTEVKNESNHNPLLELDANSSLRINPTPSQDLNAKLDAGLSNKPQQFAAFAEEQPQRQASSHLSQPAAKRDVWLVGLSLISTLTAVTGGFFWIQAQKPADDLPQPPINPLPPQVPNPAQPLKNPSLSISPKPSLPRQIDCKEQLEGKLGRYEGPGQVRAKTGTNGKDVLLPNGVSGVVTIIIDSGTETSCSLTAEVKETKDLKGSGVLSGQFNPQAGQQVNLTGKLSHEQEKKAWDVEMNIEFINENKIKGYSTWKPTSGGDTNIYLNRE